MNKTEDAINEGVGAVQDAYDKAADRVGDAADGLESWLKTTIETRPYTAAVAALGIGWLLGRMHRPL